MVAPATSTIVRLVGGSPPGLNTLLPAFDLEEGEIPEGTGFDLSADGLIKKGTIPTATASVEGTKTIEDVLYSSGADGIDVPFLWYYRRLFNITDMTAAGTSNLLHIGAEGYLDNFFYERGVGPVALDDVSDAVIKDITTFGADGVLVGTDKGSYALRGFNSAGRLSGLSRSHIIEALTCAGTYTAGSMGTLDGVAYLTNASGLMSYDGSTAAHASIKLKDTSLNTKAITIDHENKYIVCGTSHVYDVLNDKWFQYSGSDFSFKSRVFHNADWSPFSIDRILFVVDRTGTDDLEITYKTKYENEDFSDDNYTVDAIYDEGQYTVISHSLEYNRSVHKFQVEVTGMDSNMAIKEILLDVENYRRDDYVE